MMHSLEVEVVSNPVKDCAPASLFPLKWNAENFGKKDDQVENPKSRKCGAWLQKEKVVCNLKAK